MGQVLAAFERESAGSGASRLSSRVQTRPTARSRAEEAANRVNNAGAVLGATCSSEAPTPHY